MIADAGLLLLVATVGIIWRIHETSAVPLSLMLCAVLFYAWVLSPKQPRTAAVLMGLALGGSFLNRGLIAYIPLVAASLAVFIRLMPYRRYRRYFFFVLLFCLAIGGAWLIAACYSDQQLVKLWWQGQITLLQGVSDYSLSNHACGLLGFLWHTGSLGPLSIWYWRKCLIAPHSGKAPS